MSSVSFPAGGADTGATEDGGPVLEGVLHHVHDAQLAAVICHPHPRYGGSMNNNVVAAVASRLARARITTLCFNFRGVGGSGGTVQRPDDVADVCGALRFLAARAPNARYAVVGYSYGAAAAVRTAIAAKEPRIAALGLVALPLVLLPAGILSASKACSIPALVVAGDEDAIAPIAPLTAHVKEAQAQGSPWSIVRIAGADHFFRGSAERAVADALADFLLSHAARL